MRARCRWEGARRTGVRARRCGADANGGLATGVRDERRGRSRRGGRDAPRAGSREPDGARLRRPLDQPEATSTASAIASRRRVRRTTGGTRECLPRRPGIGTKVLATLLTESNDAVRRRDYDALRCLCGVATVTRRSGKSLLVTQLGQHPPGGDVQGGKQRRRAVPDDRRPTTGRATRSTIGPGSRPGAATGTCSDRRRRTSTHARGCSVASRSSGR